jgi:hypothetical protein
MYQFASDEANVQPEVRRPIPVVSLSFFPFFLPSFFLSHSFLLSLFPLQANKKGEKPDLV